MRDHSFNKVLARLGEVTLFAMAILTKNCAVGAAALASDIRQVSHRLYLRAVDVCGVLVPRFDLVYQEAPKKMVGNSIFRALLVSY